jgi:hypothetical protein
MSELYGFAFKDLPRNDSAALIAAGGITETGTYFFPARPAESADTPQATRDANLQTWEAQHASGPIGMIVVLNEGREPLSAAVLFRGFMIELAACVLLALLIARVASVGGTFVHRFGTGLAATLFMILAARAVDWNFFFQPDPHGLALALDGLIGWGLASFVIALIIRAPRREAAA